MINKFKYIILSLILCIIIFTSCNKNESYSEIDYDFGIIGTQHTKEKSLITYYKDNGSIVKKQKLKMQQLGTSIGSNGDYGDYLYVKVDNKYGDALKLNKIDGSYKLLNMEFLMLRMFADEDYVYGGSSSIGKGIITQYNIKLDKIENSIDIEKEIIESLYSYKDYLFMTTLTKETRKQKIYILDRSTLEVKNKYKNEVANNCVFIYGYENFVYFANATYLENDIDYPNNTLIEYDLNSSTFNYYNLNDNYLYQIFEYNNLLYITHVNLPEYNNNKTITVFNPITKEHRLIHLDDTINKAIIKDDKLYTFNKNFINIFTLNNYKLYKKIPIDEKDKNNYMVTTIFTKP